MNSMLRQHHVRLQDLKPYVRGYDPSKPQTAEEWAKIEGTLYEPGMMIFCLDAVSAPPGLTNFGKRDSESETYRVKDLCVVVGKEDGRSLVVNITASAYELRFLEVLMLEKARKAILDGKDFIFAVSAPREKISEQVKKELHNLGGLYAQGGSRRSLAVDGNGPQEPAMALVSLLGVKLTAGLGKQVLDIGSICHMIYAPDGRQEDKNKALVRAVFAGVTSAQLQGEEGAQPAEGYTPEPYTPQAAYAPEDQQAYAPGFGQEQPTFTPEASYIPEPSYQPGFGASTEPLAQALSAEQYAQPELQQPPPDATFVPEQSYTQPEYAQPVDVAPAQMEVAAWYQLAHMVEVGRTAVTSPPVAPTMAAAAAAAAVQSGNTPAVSAEQMYRSHAALVDEYAKKLVNQFTGDAKPADAAAAQPVQPQQVAPHAPAEQIAVEQIAVEQIAVEQIAVEQIAVEQPAVEQPAVEQQYSFSEQPAPYTEAQPVTDPFAQQYHQAALEPGQPQAEPSQPNYASQDYTSQFKHDFEAGLAGPQAIEFAQKSAEQERELFPPKESTPDPYIQLASAAAITEAQSPIPEFVDAIFETAGRGTLEYNSTGPESLSDTTDWSSAMPPQSVTQQPEPESTPEPLTAEQAQAASEELFRQKDFESNWHQAAEVAQSVEAQVFLQPAALPIELEPPVVAAEPQAQAVVPQEVAPQIETPPVQEVIQEASVDMTPAAPQESILPESAPQAMADGSGEADGGTLFERLGQQLSKTPPTSSSPRRSSSNLKALPEQVVNAETTPQIWTQESGGSLFEPPSAEAAAANPASEAPVPAEAAPVVQPDATPAADTAISAASPEPQQPMTAEPPAPVELELAPAADADKWQRPEAEPTQTVTPEPEPQLTPTPPTPAPDFAAKPETASGLPFRRPRPRRGVEPSSAPSAPEPSASVAAPPTQPPSTAGSEVPISMTSPLAEPDAEPTAQPPVEASSEEPTPTSPAEPPADYQHLAEALSGLLDSDSTEWQDIESAQTEPSTSEQPQEPQTFVAEPPAEEPAPPASEPEEDVTAAAELPPYTVLSTGYEPAPPPQSPSQPEDDQPPTPPVQTIQPPQTGISSQDVAPVTVPSESQATPPPPPLGKAATPFALQSSAAAPAEPPQPKEPFAGLTDSGVRRAPGADMTDSGVRRAPGADITDSGVRRAPGADITDSAVRRAPGADMTDSAVRRAADAEALKKKSIDFQEPKLVMNEMATLMSKLEQQVSKAAKRLGNRSDELRQRLNTQVEQLVEDATQAEKQSEVTASGLAERLNKQLDDVAEEIRAKVLETTGYGSDSFKRTLGKSHTDIEDDRAHLFDTLSNACKEFRQETDSLTKKTEFKLQSLIGQKTRELKGMIDVICDAMDDGEHSYGAALQVRFERFNERMTEEVNSMVTSLERNVRSMTEEIEAARDRAHEKLSASNSDFQQTVNHTVRTAELGLGQKTRTLLTSVILPREKEHRAILQTMSLEMRKQFIEDSSNQSRGQLQGLQSSLSAAREQLQELVEECMSSIDSVGRGQQSGLEEIFKSTSDRIERITNRAARVLQDGEKEINASEAICKRLAETSSVETEPELNEERNAAISKLQQLKQQAGHELENTIERGCDRLERLSEDMNSELMTKRVEHTNGVREAADQGLAKVREAFQEAFQAIQAAREKFMD